MKLNFLLSLPRTNTVKELSEEQKQMICLSEEFQRFVLKSGKIIERALSESVDIYLDYIGGSDSDEGS